MGFFSVNCLGCGHSLRSSHTHGHGHWTNFAVALTESGNRLVGEYDGYGRIGSYDAGIGAEPMSAYHRSCWMILGQPDHYTVDSDDASDQGYFCGSEPQKPATIEDLAELRAAAKREHEEARKAWEEARASLED